jgi:PilZ domain-containing protein
MRRERRKNFRVEWHSAATICDLERRSEQPCTLSDFSNGGAKISGIAAHEIPDEFMLNMGRGLGRARRCRVVWRADDTVGVQFTDPAKPGGKPSRESRVREDAK